jgi:hypothetical protein
VGGEPGHVPVGWHLSYVGSTCATLQHRRSLHLNRRTTYQAWSSSRISIISIAILHLCDMQLQRTRLLLLASDHLPLVADFELEGDTTS